MATTQLAARPLSTAPAVDEPRPVEAAAPTAARVLPRWPLVLIAAPAVARTAPIGIWPQFSDVVGPALRAPYL